MKVGWTEVPLGDIAAINPRLTERPPDDEPVSFVTMAGLLADEAHTIAGDVRRFRDVSHGYSQFRRDDLLVAKITPCFENGKIGRATIATPIGVGSTEFHIVRTDPRYLDIRYVLNFMRRDEVRRQGILRMTGSAGQRRVPESFLTALKIPLPPLDEQRRIARVLDMARHGRSVRMNSFQCITTLIESHFIALFGDPGRNPLGWETAPLSQFVSAFEGGRSFARADDDDSDAPYRVLRVSAVTSGVFRPTESRPVPREYLPPARHGVRPGDLLISRANTSELVGAVALVEGAYDGLLLPDKIWRFVWRDDKSSVPEFVWQLFQSRVLRTAISRRSTGTSGSMKNISAQKLMGIEVIRPPVERQREFARLFRQARKVSALATRHLTELDALFESLQSRAFSGGL